MATVRAVDTGTDILAATGVAEESTPRPMAQAEVTRTLRPTVRAVVMGRAVAMLTRLPMVQVAVA